MRIKPETTAVLYVRLPIVILAELRAIAQDTGVSLAAVTEEALAYALALDDSLRLRVYPTVRAHLAPRAPMWGIDPSSPFLPDGSPNPSRG